MPPGNYSGNTSGNWEFDQAGTYTITGSGLTVSNNTILTIGKVGVAVNLLIQNDATLTVGFVGRLNVSSPASFQIQEYGGTGTPQGITVNGTMAVTSAAFAFSGGQGGDTSYIQVNSGGHLTAVNSTFGWDQVVLAYGSILNAGDLTGNGFDATALYVPANFVPLVANNPRFGNVFLTANPSLPTLNLGPLGTLATQTYVLAGALTVQQGTTVNVGEGANILMLNDATLTVNGTLNVSSPARFEIQEYGGNGTPQGITVNGTMAVTSAAFAFSGGQGGDTSYIQVNSGGRLDNSGGNFGWDRLAVGAGAIANIRYLSISSTSQLQIDSTATTNLHFNDFSSMAAQSIVANPATGHPNDHINLTNNYWGTSSTATINGIILDHLDDSNRPTIDYLPLLATRPVGVVTVTANGGAFQRSRVTSVTIQFSVPVTFAGATAAAFRLSRIGGGVVGGFTAAASVVGGATVVTLSNFTGAETVGGSLADGRYTITVLASQVTATAGGQQLDGNDDGIAGGDYVLNGTAANGLFRYYGDFDGDGDVDGSDLVAFVPTLFNAGNYNPTFDFDGDGDVDGTDLFKFVQNLFVPLP
ncbi:MAG: hypothetical protein U0746_19655 [Gemmataceae bacterium]